MILKRRGCDPLVTLKGGLFGRFSVVVRNGGFWHWAMRFILSILVAALSTPSVYASRIYYTSIPSLLRAINQKYRSSSHDIDANVYLKTAFPQIGSGLLKQLAELSPDKIIEGFRNCPECEPNQAVVENIIKISLLARACVKLCVDSEPTELISKQFHGLPQIKQKISGFPKVNPGAHGAGEFNYGDYLLKERAQTNPLNNDLYNFKMASAYFMENKHKTHQSTFRLFSRGHQARGYIVSMGQDQVLDLLEGLHFTDYQINVLKKNPEFRHIKKEFWTYLRNFHFSGSVRMVPPGTLVFQNEPIMEVTGNPVEVTLLETLMIPWINKMSNYATAAARLVDASGGRFLIDGSSRRGGDGFWSAYAAMAAGFGGTSNVETADLLGLKPYGSQAHQWLGHFEDEVLAHATYREYFPEGTLLVDTYDILEGVRRAARATGGKFRGIRLDSAIDSLAPKDPVEAERLTVLAVQKLLKEMGLDPLKINITYSNKQTAHTLREHTARQSPFQVAVVGTEIAAPAETPHLNVVYKVVEVTDLKKQETHFPIKLATGKVLQPGSTQIYRVFNQQGTIERDIFALKEESLEGVSSRETAMPLVIEVMRGGRRLQPKDSLVVQQERVRNALDRLPAPVRAITQNPDSIPLILSRGVQRAIDQAKQKALGIGEVSVGVFMASADPFHDMHEEMIRRAQARYQFARIYVVLTGENRVHKEDTLFTSEERLAMAQRRFSEGKVGGAEIIFWDGEIKGHTQYAIDTLDAIRAKELEGLRPQKKAPFTAHDSEDFWDSELRTASSSSPHSSSPHSSPPLSPTPLSPTPLSPTPAIKLWVLAGSDSFESLGTWKSPKRLLNEFNWVVAERKGGDFDLLRISQQVRERLLDNFDRRAQIAIGPQGNQIEFGDFNLEDQSSSFLRQKYEKVKFVFHEVDAQLSFWKGMHGMDDGPLALEGTPAITENIEALKWLAKTEGSIKATASGDEHFGIELKYPDLNEEFHPGGLCPEGLPAHCMAGVIGPVGDDRIPEVRVFENHRVLEIKHHRPVAEGLELVPFNLKAHIDQILDPDIELYLRKNGPGSTSLWKNPATTEVFKRLQPEAIYVFGVASDVCVPGFVLGALKEGYRVHVIEDAIAGITESGAQKSIAEMKAAGATFLKTQDVLKLFGRSLSEVKRDLQTKRQCRRSLGGN